jgi:hypothetical protein
MGSREEPTKRSWGTGAAVTVLIVSALSIVQSTGYWLLSAVNGEPTRMMFVDHGGPAITSGLIGLATLGIGLAMLATARRAARPS